MLCCDISDQLLNQYCLTNSGTTEQTDLTTFCIWCKKVDDLDSCLKNLYNRTLLFKCWWLSVDDPLFASVIGSPLSIVSPSTLNSLPKCLLTNWYFEYRLRSLDFHILAKSFAGGKHQTTYLIISRCCATSMMHFFPLFSTSRASLIKEGRRLSNTTSTTGPMTCTIRPLFMSLSAFCICPKQLPSLLLLCSRTSCRLP